LGKIKILHPQKHSIPYGYASWGFCFGIGGGCDSLANFTSKDFKIGIAFPA